MKKRLLLIILFVVVFSQLFACTNKEKIEDESQESIVNSENDSQVNVTTIITTEKELKSENTTKETTEGDEVDNSWALFLVNQTYTLPEDYTISTMKIFGDYAIDERAAQYAIKMFDDAKLDGVDLKVISAYRTIEYQKKLFDKNVKEYEQQGMTHEEAVEETSKNVAVPGQSEHNAGLAIDILSDDWDSLTEGFATTAASAWR